MRKYFLTGLFVLLPLVVTLYLLYTGFMIIDGLLGRFVLRLFGHDITGAGTILSIILIFLTGLFATNVLGRRIINLGERVFLTIPIVRNIYLGVKQLTDAFSNSAHPDAFKRVVLLEYPRTGVYSVAFVTTSGKGEVQNKTPEPCITVFIPTTPNPTSGFFLIVPEEECIALSMTVEEAFKLIISAGVISPPWKGEGQTLATPRGTLKDA